MRKKRTTAILTVDHMVDLKGLAGVRGTTVTAELEKAIAAHLEANRKDVPTRAPDPRQMLLAGTEGARDVQGAAMVVAPQGGAERPRDTLARALAGLPGLRA